MIEPPTQDAGVLPDQEAPPPQMPEHDDGGVEVLAGIDDVRQEIRSAIVSAAQAFGTSTGPQEVKDFGQGLLAAAQALVAVSPAMNPKVFESLFLPEPEPSPDKTAGDTKRPPKKAT